jgi:hypothetical protein
MKANEHGSDMHRSAEFSPCRRYRYLLWRAWGIRSDASPVRYAMIVGLNPSTADEISDDPTIRRCVAFARSWGCSALCMTNLFAYRATEPADMLAQPDPTGPDNDVVLVRMAANATIVVAAWGIHGDHLGRASEVARLLPRLHYLRLTKNGHPGHPLYLPGTLRPVEWVSDVHSIAL